MAREASDLAGALTARALLSSCGKSVRACADDRLRAALTLAYLRLMPVLLSRTTSRTGATRSVDRVVRAETREAGRRRLPRGPATGFSLSPGLNGCGSNPSRVVQLIPMSSDIVV